MIKNLMLALAWVGIYSAGVAVAYQIGKRRSTNKATQEALKEMGLRHAESLKMYAEAIVEIRQTNKTKDELEKLVIRDAINQGSRARAALIGALQSIGADEAAINKVLYVVDGKQDGDL